MKPMLLMTLLKVRRQQSQSRHLLLTLWRLLAKKLPPKKKQ